MESKKPGSPWPVHGPAPEQKREEGAFTQPDPDLDAIWRLAVGLDLGTRSVLEAEVLLWRICNAKSLSSDLTRRALNSDWEND